MPASTITVTSAEDFVTAYQTLSTTGGGTILVAEGAEKYALAMSGRDAGTDPVTIRSADPDDPVELARVSITYAENIRLEGLNVDSSDIPADESASNLHIYGSKNIEVLDSTFESRADGFLNKASDPNAGDIFGNIKESTDIVFSGNTVSNYFHGLGVFESQRVEISDNDFSGIQGDGIRMGSIQQVSITDNHLHDFYGSSNSTNHDDMIQLWSVGADDVTRDLTITGNFLNSGDGQASQSIFIGNERDKTEPDHIYENIVITDNVIYNGHKNGIVVSGARGVTVEDNTLLHNPTAYMYSNQTEWEEDDGSTGAPAIRFARVEDGEARGNIATSMPTAIDGRVISEDNQLVNFGNALSGNYVGEHFINAETGGTVDLRDLRLKDESPWVGKYGAEASQPDSVSDDGETEAVAEFGLGGDDIWSIDLDASRSLDGEGALEPGDYTYVWTFDDGSTLEGVRVTKTFDAPGEQNVRLDIFRDGELLDTITRDLRLVDKTYAKMTFDDGIEDLSSYASNLKKAEEENLVADREGGQAYHIGGDDRIGLDRGNEQQHNLETFGLRLDLKLDQVGKGGELLSFHKVMSAKVDSEGAITFKITTGDGDFTMKSDPVLNDTQWHEFGLAFDGVNGTMSMTLDGGEIAGGEAWGMTAGKSSYGLYFGSTFGSAVPATIDNILFGADPEMAGIELEPNPNPRPEPEPEPAPVAEEEDDGTAPRDGDDGTDGDDRPSGVKPSTGRPEKPVSRDETGNEPPARQASREEASEKDEDDSGFAAILKSIFSIFTKIFGGGRGRGGRDDEDGAEEAVGVSVSRSISIEDLIPSTGTLPEHDFGSAEDEGEDADKDMANLFGF